MACRSCTKADGSPVPGSCEHCGHVRGRWRSIRDDAEYERAARVVKDLEACVGELDSEELERLRIGTEAIVAYEIFTGRV